MPGREQRGVALRARIYGLDDVVPGIRLHRGLAAQAFRQGRRAEGLEQLAQGHGRAAEDRVHPSGRVAVQDVFPGAEGQKAEAAADVGQLKHKGRAESAQFTVDGVHGVVEVGAVENRAHARGHLVQPSLYRALAGQVRIVQAEAEPGPGRTGQPALQPCRQGAHGQNARSVYQPTVEQGALFRRVRFGLQPTAGGQKVVRQALPGRVPGGASAQQGLITPDQIRKAGA